MKRKMYDRSLKLGISWGNGQHEGDKKAKILPINKAFGSAKTCGINGAIELLIFETKIATFSVSISKDLHKVTVPRLPSKCNTLHLIFGMHEFGPLRKRSSTNSAPFNLFPQSEKSRHQMELNPGLPLLRHSPMSTFPSSPEQSKNL